MKTIILILFSIDVIFMILALTLFSKSKKAWILGVIISILSFFLAALFIRHTTPIWMIVVMTGNAVLWLIISIVDRKIWREEEREKDPDDPQL